MDRPTCGWWLRHRGKQMSRIKYSKQPSLCVCHSTFGSPLARCYQGSDLNEAVFRPGVSLSRTCRPWTPSFPPPAPAPWPGGSPRWSPTSSSGRRMWTLPQMTGSPCLMGPTSNSVQDPTLLCQSPGMIQTSDWILLSESRHIWIFWDFEKINQFESDFFLVGSPPSCPPRPPADPSVPRVSHRNGEI